MPFTLECGVCHSLYRIEETQITVDGIKITCPKCLSFFFLKRGSKILETPIVEQLAHDGIFEVQASHPISSEETLDIVLSEKSAKEVDPLGLISKEAFTEPEASITPPSKPNPIPQKKEENVIYHRIRTNELSDYPSDEPVKSKIDSLLIPAAIVAILLAVLFFLNQKGIIPIPGLQSLQEKPSLPPSVSEETKNSLPSQPTPKPRYVLPTVDETGKITSSMTPSPSPSPKPIAKTPRSKTKKTTSVKKKR